MSLLDHLRSEYLRGKIIKKYRLPGGNISLVIDEDGTHNRYHVRFVDDYRNEPCIDNLFGLLKDPFSGKTEHLDRLLAIGNNIQLTTSYSKGPFREAYRLHSVSIREPGGNNRKSYNLPYRLPYRDSTYKTY